jgi:HlyD family secretion protein
MSVTTIDPQRPEEPGATPPEGGPSGGRFTPPFLRRSRVPKDDTPAEMLEFYSPSVALTAVGPKPIARSAVLLITTMILILIVLCATISIDRIVVAQGKVISLAPELVVQPMNPGIVKTIAVTAGDVVHKGQLLAQLDPTYAVADLAAARDQVDRYQTEIDRLNAENKQVPYRPHDLSAGALVQEGLYAQRAAAREAELRYYQGQIDAQRALLLQADANIRQYAKETGVAVDVEKMRKQLEKDQVGSRLDTLAAVSARLETEREVLTFVQQEENAKQTLASLKGQLDNYNQQWFADVSETIMQDAVQLATYKDQLEHAALNAKLIDLRADQDATVLSVAPVSVGAVLQPGQTFFTLVPLNAPLEVDAQMTTDQTGFVFVGQPVQIKFQTFPSLEFGYGLGSVRVVSPDSFLTSSNQQSNGPSASGTTPDSVFTGTNTATAPFFNDVRVTIDRMNLKNLPKDFVLVPGMQVEADIVVGDRTILQYITERVLPILTEGMREPS